MILDNPFRRLGIRATASPREVRRRLDELTVKASLGAAPELPADELSRLRQALEDPVQRVRHEIFWVHSPADGVDPAVDITSSNGSLATALDVLRGEAGRAASPEQAVALHDLAVLTYARFLSAGNGADPGDALPLWASVLESAHFWEHMAARATAAGDARLTEQVIEQIRSELPALLLEPLASQTAAQIDEGDPDAAAASLRFVRRSGLRRAAIEEAARRAIVPLRVNVVAGAAAVETLIQAVPASEGPTVETRRRLKAAEKALVERVLAPMLLLKKVDPVLDDEALGDRAATATRLLSVAVCNLLEDWAWGYALIREAMEMARTPTFLAQLAGDQAQVAGNYHHAQATDAAKLRRPDAAVAHYELALTYARSEEDRTWLTNLAAGARTQGRVNDRQVDAQKSLITAALERRQNALKLSAVEALNSAASLEEAEPVAPNWTPPTQRAAVSAGRPHRRGWVIGGAIAAVLAIVIAIAAAHSKPATTSGVPAAPAPAKATPASQSSLDCGRASILDREVEALDRQITVKRRLILRLAALIAPIEAQINQIRRDYPSNQLPTDVWNRFVPLRAQYRSLAVKSDRAVRDGNALIRLYNKKLKTYRRLNGEC